MKEKGSFWVDSMKWAEGREGRVKRCAQEKQTMCRDVGESSSIWTSHLTNTPREAEGKTAILQSLDFVITADNLGLHTTESLSVCFIVKLQIKYCIYKDTEI